MSSAKHVSTKAIAKVAGRTRSQKVMDDPGTINAHLAVLNAVRPSDSPMHIELRGALQPFQYLPWEVHRARGGWTSAAHRMPGVVGCWLTECDLDPYTAVVATLGPWRVSPCAPVDIGLRCVHGAVKGYE